MKMKTHLALLACLTFAGATYAEEAGETLMAATVNVTEPTVTAQADAVSALNLASQLAEYGEANQMPEALVAAALIVHNNPTREDAVQKTNTSSPITEEKESSNTPLDAEALLMAAAELPGGESMAELASEKISERAKGDVNGAGSWVTQVLANDYDLYEFTFRGRELARIIINGDDDTDLDLYVYDEYGTLVASSTSYGDREAVSFTPAYTSTYTVKVKNLGSVYNEYVGWTN